MGFFSGLGNAINTQFGTGETQSLNSISFENLGSFANQIDQSAQRYYYEDGFVRNFRPRNREVYFQEPHAYVVIKKRMFSSLADTYRVDLMEEKERLVFTGTKKLFQNKCALISAYEKLSKIEKYTQQTGYFNTYFGAQVLDFYSQLTSVIGGQDQGLTDAMNTLRKVMSYSNPSYTTSWTTNDYDSVFNSSLGDGTGTFELTLIKSIDTTVTDQLGGGSANFILEDPYNLTLITSQDIDQALIDVTNPMSNGLAKFTAYELNNNIEMLKQQLNQLREARGAGDITFMVSDASFSGKKVMAILDQQGIEIIFSYGSGIEANVNALTSINSFKSAVSAVGQIFTLGQVNIDQSFIGDGPSQLNQAEAQIFSAIITTIYTSLASNQNNQTQLNLKNKDINYARNRLRLLFNGKYIIQPMDVVSIFMSTSTMMDDKLSRDFQSNTQGSFGQQTAQKFDSLLRNLNNSMNIVNGSSDTFDDIERKTIAGENFPKWLWQIYKNDILGNKTGICIFHGLCRKPQGTFLGGKSTLTVPCVDNSDYFKKGQVNFKPSLDVFNSAIYDPLTPFDVSFDASTGAPITDVKDGNFPPLLPENQALINTNHINFRSGPNRNQTITQNNYNSGERENWYLQQRSVLRDPEGFVYRWKQGIQAITKTSPQFPSSSTEDERAILLTAQPFAGQDVMNVLSLLITGQPYNYESFLQAALENGNATGVYDPTTGQSAAKSFIQGLNSALEENNEIWGNFIPFKKLVMDSEVDKYIAQTKFDLTSQNQQLLANISKKAQLTDQVALMSQHNTYVGNEPTNPYIPQLQSQINDLNNQINTQISTYMKQISSSSASVGISAVGSTVSNPVSNPANSTETDKEFDALEFRRKSKALTLRRYWETKSNQDRNYFIVDDQYDKNLDVQAFSRAIGNKIELFNSEFNNTFNKISEVALLLDLRVYANTQGHIVVEPTSYNKIPSSVFYKMFRDKDLYGTKVFPDFLESLYTNQIKGLVEKIEITEDQIRLRGIALGGTDDSSIISIINSGSSGVNNAAPFSFITDSNGNFGSNFKKAVYESTPDQINNSIDNSLSVLSDESVAISNVLKAKNIFNVNAQVVVLGNSNTYININTLEQNAEVVRHRLRAKTGQEPTTISELFGNKQLGNFKIESQVDKYNIIQQLANQIADRQTSLRSLSSAINSLSDGLSINAPSNGSPNVADAVLTPYLNKRTKIPTVLSHMIEYEEDDDLGPGSGKRFVVTGGQYNSLTIGEEEPPYTMVTVNGLFGEGFVNPPGSLNIGAGNVVSTAFAVDYDMWYLYGFKASQTIQAPFFSDPDSQCAPYAVSNLTKCRKNIFQGSINITAYNEYYQPGDVIYIEDRDCLFYVSRVQHSYTEKSLKSTLALQYGHNPGEYIPNMLDVIGKIIFNSKGYTGQFRHDRYDTTGSLKSLGCVENASNLLTNTRNLSVINNAITATSGKLTNSNVGSGSAVVIRVYSDDLVNSGISVRTYILDKIGQPDSSQLVTLEVVTLEDNIFYRKYPTTGVVVEYVNEQNPSSAAWGVVRQIYTASADPTNMMTYLQNNCIDIFFGMRDLTNAPKPISTTSNNLYSQSTSQSGQQNNATIKQNTGVVLDPINDNSSINNSPITNTNSSISNNPETTSGVG